MKTRTQNKSLAITLSTALTVITLAISANVSAAGGGLGAMDRNNDGKISFNEWDQEFAKMDKDKDGYLSGSEMEHVKAQGQMMHDSSRKHSGSTGKESHGTSVK